ncbi:hypothetical protein ACFL0N_03660 [Pseudomonadota bacterium]
MKHYQIMIRFVFSLIVLSWAIAMTVPAKAGELVVTRYFSGLWDQPRQEAQLKTIRENTKRIIIW